ncbi:MAG: methyltransferase domain-containing protein [Burkholderiaceae bacterium]
MLEPLERFSHVANFTDYMAIVERLLLADYPAPVDVLDMPAGNGILSERLRGHGHRVTRADINGQHPDYVFANMEKALPFERGQFDAVTCLEGIEHVIEPASLSAELSRILRPGGRLYLSLPNVQSMYSRLSFLLTGTCYQFAPEQTTHPRGEMVDRGHINPLGLPQLAYLFAEHGLVIERATGDKVKKRVLMPLYLPLWGLSFLATRRRRQPLGAHHQAPLFQLMNSYRPLFSRSIVIVFRKQTLA